MKFDACKSIGMAVIFKVPDRGNKNDRKIMSLILCRRRADKPFYHSKLNIELWTEQELCYVIYHYPLLCLKDFVDERLLIWLSQELGLEHLVNLLKENVRAGESPENQLMCILQECNYYTAGEVMDFGKHMAELRKCSEDELILKEGKLLYAAGKYTAAYDRISEALRVLNESLRYMKNGLDKAKLSERKADMLCDLAVIALKMTDEKKALELLISSELTYYNKRAVKMRYLINGAGELGDDEKAELDKIKNEAVRKSHETKGYKEISELFERDSIRIIREAKQIISSWKNNYRMM